MRTKSNSGHLEQDMVLLVRSSPKGQHAGNHSGTFCPSKVIHDEYIKGSMSLTLASPVETHLEQDPHPISDGKRKAPHQSSNASGISSSIFPVCLHLCHNKANITFLYPYKSLRLGNVDIFVIFYLYFYNL